MGRELQRNRLTWLHGSPFSVILQKTRKRCTTISECTEHVSWWSWVSDDNNFHYASHHKQLSSIFSSDIYNLFPAPTPPIPSNVAICPCNHPRATTIFRLYCLRWSEVRQQICNSCITLRHLFHRRCLHWHIYQHSRQRSSKVSLVIPSIFIAMWCSWGCKSSLHLLSLPDAE